MAQMGEREDFVLTQMKRSIEKLGCSAEMYGEAALMRFLIARSMDPEKAAKMFAQWLKWRSSMVPNGFISESEVPDELEAQKIFLQGLSKNKYPVLIIKACKHFPSKDQIQFKKFVVYMLDKTVSSVLKLLTFTNHWEDSACWVEALTLQVWNAFKGREIGNEKLIGIIDLQQIAYKNIDARGLITGFQFLQAYYPERLAKCYILHMPWFFVSVWRLVSRFLEKATLEKIAMVNNDDERREFIKEVGEDVLPEEYGGQSRLVPIQDVVLTPCENGTTN